MSRRIKHSHIYLTTFHIFTTGFLIVAPFVYLFYFSRAANVESGKLFLNLGVSFFRLFLAYIFSVALAWGSAILFYKGKISIIVLPIFDILQSVPIFAALPIATYFWGPSNFTITFFLILAVIWPIFFSVLSSLKLIRKDWDEAVAIMRISKYHRLTKFILPASWNGIITGSIVGLGDGYEAMIATEMVIGAQIGLGKFFQGFSSNFTITAFGILGILIIIFAINKIIWLPLLERSHKMMEE